MPLPSFLQRLRQRSTASGADANLPLSSAEIEVARVRARRRLVGMVVLVGVGVVGLPWLFETQPRPIGSDVQVVSAVAHAGGPAVSTGPKPAIASVTEPPAPVEEEEIEAPAKPASKPVAARASAPAAPPVTAVAKPSPVRPQPASQAVASGTPKPEKPAARESAKPAESAASKDAARAKALLDGKSAMASANKPASDAAGTRYVVQIGAFSDVPAAREVRLKAERAGVKTYTQEVTVNGGKKIRVRVGPYASKAEADKAVDTLRKAGMSSALLTL